MRRNTKNQIKQLFSFKNYNKGGEKFEDLFKNQKFNENYLLYRPSYTNQLYEEILKFMGRKDFKISKGGKQ
jgi:hypothetical protein